MAQYQIHKVNSSRQQHINWHLDQKPVECLDPELNACDPNGHYSVTFWVKNRGAAAWLLIMRLSTGHGHDHTLVTRGIHQQKRSIEKPDASIISRSRRVYMKTKGRPW